MIIKIAIRKPSINRNHFLSKPYLHLHGSVLELGFCGQFWFHGFVELGEPRRRIASGFPPDSTSWPKPEQFLFSLLPPNDASLCSSLPSPPGLCQSLLFPASPNKQTLNTHTQMHMPGLEFVSPVFTCEIGAPSPPSPVLFWAPVAGVMIQDEIQSVPSVVPQIVIHSSYRKRHFFSYKAKTLFPLIVVSETVKPEGQDMGGIWAPRVHPALPGVATCSTWDTGPPYSF